MQARLSIEVWSDVQCVWCYVGDARLKRALESLDGAVEVTHRAFELQPGSPVDFDAQTYLEESRGLDADARERVFTAMKDTAAAEGLEYRPEIIRPTNSHLALELLHHAETVGLRQQLSDRLYRGYFVEGRHIGTIAALGELASEVGIDPDDARDALTRGLYSDAVDRDAAAGHSHGARGVPFMVINDAYVIPGAVATDELRRFLAEVAAE